MSIGWMILINGIIGMVIYVPVIVIFTAYALKKFKKANIKNGCRDCKQEYDLLMDDISQGDGNKYSFMRAINLMETFFLWEIKLPASLWVLYQYIKKRSNSES